MNKKHKAPVAWVFYLVEDRCLMKEIVLIELFVFMWYFVAIIKKINISAVIILQTNNNNKYIMNKLCIFL